MIRFKKTFFYFFILIFIGSISFPFLWLLLGSFKTMLELFSTPIQFWPSTFKFDNYSTALTSQPFGQYLVNSFLIAGITTLIIVMSASMASYAIARTDIRGKKLVLIILLTVSLLPPITLLQPIYQMMSTLNLLNTTIGLALVLSAVELPTAVWLLTSFFQSVPFEIEESGVVDGASMPTIFFRMIFPLVAPGVFTVSIMTFIAAWNNYIFAAVLNQYKTARTVTIALLMFQTDTYTPWHVISAASIICSVPLIIVVLILQKRIISGMLDGSVKG